MKGTPIVLNAEEKRYVRNFWRWVLVGMFAFAGLFKLAMMLSPALVGVGIVTLFIVVGGLAIGAGARRGNGQRGANGR